MSTRSFSAGFCLLAALTAASVSALAGLSETGTSSASFTATGPGGLKIVGTTTELKVAGTDTVTVTVPLAKLSTGIALRDSHMREKYLQVGQYPDAILTVPRASLTMPAAGASTEGDANGTLTLHGQTRPTAFHYSVRRDATAYSVTGQLHCNMRDFGVDVPTYMGVGVKPDVDVTVQFGARDDS